MTRIKTEEDRKINKSISFSEEDGKIALKWLECKKKEKGGMSKYITRLLLEDMQRKLFSTENKIIIDYDELRDAIE